jgi:hypothetical protein
MTPAGVAPIADQIGSPDDPLEIPEWIAEQLRAEPEVWKQFRRFSVYYQRLKIGWIREAGTGPKRQGEAQRRLDYLLKMTAAGKRYGTIPIDD